MVVDWILAVAAILILSLALSRFVVTRSFEREMRTGGRFVPWRELESSLRLGRGTVIVNHTNLPGRIWWSEGTVDEADLVSCVMFSARLCPLPRQLRDADALRQRFPAATVKEISGSIRRLVEGPAGAAVAPGTPERRSHE